MSAQDARVGRIERRGWALAALLVLLSLALRSLPVTGGVILGALLAIVNFKWLCDFAGALLTGGGGRVSRFLVVLYTLKYVFTGAAIFVAFKYGLVDVFALLAGVSVIFLAICLEGISANRSLKEGVDHA